MQRVAVIDYGMGNLRSVAKAVEHAAEGTCDVVVTNDAGAIAAADRVVVPGQGAARDCMQAIGEHGVGKVIAHSITDKPFLGICMGLQVLLDRSEEHGGTDCLGLLRGQVRRFDRDLKDPKSGARLSVPQMGWNRVHAAQAHPLWNGIASGERFYFANSYFADPEDTSVVAGRTTYGCEFASAIAFGCAFAVQFHPEKSQRAGLRLLSNFLRWDGRA
ncbi:MAG: imidazole glycerol phosphate synthase subunit HisH [Gammaproteobacteria bacterium]